MTPFLISALDDRLSASCPHSFIFVKQGEKYVWLGNAANLDSVAKEETMPLQWNRTPYVVVNKLCRAM
jgi:hypothetical protein